MNTYSPRRYRSSPSLGTHVSLLYGISHMPSGCGGKTLGPPILRLSRPLAASTPSRIISASIRKRGPRASRRLYGSRSASAGGEADDWRYVEDDTISL